MSVFVQSTPAPRPKTKTAQQVSVAYAAVVVAMAVAQLYSFETFSELILSFNLPLGEVFSYVAAPLIIICEVFALPFLLSMRLSPAFRVVSMLCSWLVPIKWFFISLWVVLTSYTVTNIGFLGDIEQIQLMPGWWAVMISLAMGVAAAWASWGMWPFSKAKK